MRFYGLSHHDVNNLSGEDAEGLFKCIEVLEANETMLALKISDWPSMKETARSKLYRALNKAANPSILKSEGKALTAEDLAALINSK